MKNLDVIVAMLLVVGGLNWGLVGAAGFDLLGGIFGPASIVSRAIYMLVGMSAVYQAAQWRAIQSRWQWASTASSARR